jgi:competence protein ComEC
MVRMMKWWSWIVVGVFFGLVWVGVQAPSKNLQVVFCDVGQGDATLIIKGDFQMVVDGGPSGERLLSCLGRHVPFWDRKIEVVVNTHPEKDHLGGLDDLVERYEVDRLVINGVFGGGKDGERLRELSRRGVIQLEIPKEGDVLRLGGLRFDILWPEERVGSQLAWSDPTRTDLSGEIVLGKNTDVNEVSVVGILKYGKFKVMLTGDIGVDQEERIETEDVDVLKVAHHGSRYSSSEEFVSKVSPEVAVISVGKNSYGHPTKEVLDKLERVGAKILRTDIDGDVKIVSNGQKYWVGY